MVILTAVAIDISPPLPVRECPHDHYFMDTMGMLLCWGKLPSPLQSNAIQNHYNIHANRCCYWFPRPCQGTSQYVYFFAPAEYLVFTGSSRCAQQLLTFWGKLDPPSPKTGRIYIFNVITDPRWCVYYFPSIASAGRDHGAGGELILAN